MVDILGTSKRNISRNANGISKLLFEKFKTVIEFDERQFSKENCERFSNAIFEQGACFSHIVGFIDGTTQQICRPKNIEIQNLSYNRQMHIHCLNYQTIITPDGITSSLYGPYCGSNNSQNMFNSSKVLPKLFSHFEKISPEKAIAIYGDESYPLDKHIVPPFPKATITEIEEECNVSMSKIRVAAEMEFGKTEQLFTAVKWKYGNKLLQTKPALYYILASIFKNFHTYIHGSSVTNMFKLKPPSLEEYILGLMRERNESNLLE